MRITESQLKRMIRRTINEMSDDGMGSISMHNQKKNIKMLGAVALGCADPGFEDLLCDEIGNELCGQLMSILHQLRAHYTYGG